MPRQRLRVGVPVASTSGNEQREREAFVCLCAVHGKRVPQSCHLLQAPHFGPTAQPLLALPPSRPPLLIAPPRPSQPPTRRGRLHLACRYFREQNAATCAPLRRPSRRAFARPAPPPPPCLPLRIAPAAPPPPSPRVRSAVPRPSGQEPCFISKKR